MRQRTVFATTLLLAVALVAAGLAITGPGQLHTLVVTLLHGDLAQLRDQLQALGARAALGLSVLVLAHTVLPFPAELLAAAGGFALGFAAALPVLLVSFLVSALLAYWIGAGPGHWLARRLAGEARMQALERLVQRAGAGTLLALRIFPVVPFSPLSMACGVVRVPPGRYLWTTALGITPELALVTFLGTQLRSPNLSDPVLWAPLAGVVSLILVGSVVLRRTRLRLAGAETAAGAGPEEESR